MTTGALAVEHSAASAAVVRHCIAEDLAGRAVPRDCIEDVVLVTSELFGNAVRHTGDAADRLSVAWDVAPGAVVVRVADPSDELPHRRPSTDRDAAGRGLAIVAAIASDWGVQRLAHGKQVWARVPIAAA
jgi:anti-sigma regulatory factor (Ser/Thr protein kinase)